MKRKRKQTYAELLAKIAELEDRIAMLERRGPIIVPMRMPTPLPPVGHPIIPQPFIPNPYPDWPIEPSWHPTWTVTGTTTN